MLWKLLRKIVVTPVENRNCIKEKYAYRYFKYSNLHNFCTSKRWHDFIAGGIALAVTFTLNAQSVTTGTYRKQEAQGEKNSKIAPARAEWAKLMVGEELSRGKEVQFVPAPDYPLTKDENDRLDLTDGKLSSREDDRIWFCKDAVGWYLTPNKNISLIVDLGQEEEVGRVAIRLLGGREQGSLVFPQKFEVLASDDGKNFHLLGSMEKLMPAEADLSDFKKTYYLPEEKKAYMHGFFFDTAVRARYIAIRLERDSGIYTDELSIQRPLKRGEVKPVSSYPSASFYRDGLVVLPRKEPMMITENILTPNFFIVEDITSGKAMQNSEVYIETPDAIDLLPNEGPVKVTKETATSPGQHLYRLTLEVRKSAFRPLQGPLFFKITDKEKLPSNPSIRIKTRVDGKDSYAVEIPFHVATIPEVSNPGILDVSLAWMNEGNALAWPDFLTNFRKLGFDYVSAFPRWYQSEDKKTGLERTYKVELTDPASREAVRETIRSGAHRALELLDSARKDGFRIICNDSPFHIMGTLLHSLKKESIPLDEQKEIYNVIDGKVGEYMSPLYRGRYFRNEMSRVRTEVELTRPQEVYVDIEWWFESVDESKNDPRMAAAWKASGKNWEDFSTDVGTTVLEELRKAIDDGARACGIPSPKLGLYNGYASGKPVQKFFEFSKIYPKIVQLSMPSLYVQGRTLDVIAKVRADYEKMGNRDIIPYLTAGTYGEFDPAHMETMVLESILNGARGVTYYIYYDFDPADYYYHARALSFLLRYPELVKEGKPLPWTGDNPDLNYTRFGTEKEQFLMIGNYKGARNNATKITVSLSSVSEVRNVAEDKPMKPEKQFKINVPPDGYVLLYIKS